MAFLFSLISMSPRRPVVNVQLRNRIKAFLCLSKCSVSHTGICFLSLNWALIVFQSHDAPVMICMKNVSAVEMMIRIPAVMTGEIES